MRFPAAYYLLLIYLTLMFRPLILIVSDAVSHTFAEAIHIATIHAKYGDNHLETSLATTEGNDNSKNQNTVKAEDSLPVHITSEANIYYFSPGIVNTTCNTFLNFYIPRIVISILVPPPKFS